MFLENQECVESCTKKYDFSRKEDRARVQLLQKAMNLNYHHHWIVGWLHLLGNASYLMKNSIF